MLAQTMLRIVADPCEQGFDLLGRQEARQSRVPALGYGRHAQSKVGLRDATLEHILEEGAHLVGSRLVAIVTCSSEYVLDDASHNSCDAPRHLGFYVAEPIVCDRQRKHND